MLLLGPLLIVSCSSTPDIDSFADDYSQNKSRYDRYFKTWDIILFHKDDPKGRVTFSPDGKIKFDGLLAAKSKEFCGTDTTSFVIGEHHENPVQRKLEWGNEDFIIMPCQDEETTLRARWYNDGRLEMNFGALRVGHYFLEPSLVQNMAKSAEIPQSVCHLTPEAAQLLKKYKGKLHHGRVGGGFDKIKWGMCKEEIAGLFPNHRQIDDGLELKINGIDATVYFYSGLAYLVEISDPDTSDERSRNELIKILIRKYGKPRIIDPKTRTERSKDGRSVFKWSNETNVFSDGNSEILADSCKTSRDDYGWTQGFCTMADTFTKTIRYRSKHLSDEISKTERAKQQKQAAENSSKY